MSKNNEYRYIVNFDDEYRVTNYKDAGVTRVEKLVKRKRNKEVWKTIFQAHTSLLQEFAQEVKE
jgi:hypothetical protein